MQPVIIQPHKLLELNVEKATKRVSNRETLKQTLIQRRVQYSLVSNR